MLVDANVLLNAVNLDSQQHEAARSWIDGALSDGEPVGFSWLVIVAFIRIATKPGIFPTPLSADEAVDFLRGWLGQPSATVREATARHLDVLAGLIADVGTAGNLVSDAHLAALAVEYDASVVTFDRDFLRFGGVDVIVPGQP
jgi:toxin-antitoxin system PIN domain toxin